MKVDKILDQIEEMGDAHALSSANTPLRENAFEMSDDEKINIIRENIKKIMEEVQQKLLKEIKATSNG